MLLRSSSFFFFFNPLLDHPLVFNFFDHMSSLPPFQSDTISDYFPRQRIPENANEKRKNDLSSQISAFVKAVILRYYLSTVIIPFYRWDFEKNLLQCPSITIPSTDRSNLWNYSLRKGDERILIKSLTIYIPYYTRHIVRKWLYKMQ